MRKRVTSIDKKYKLLQQNDLTINDIMDLCEIGRTGVMSLRRDIESKIAPCTLPAKIPTWLVVKHKPINIDYIIGLYQLTTEGEKHAIKNHSNR